MSKRYTVGSAAASKRLRFCRERRERQAAGLVRRHRVQMNFEQNSKAGPFSGGSRQMMHPTCEARLVPARKRIAEIAEDGDRALGVGGIDQHVNVDHRAQFWARINAVCQGRALEENDRDAYGGESYEQLIDAFFAGNGGAAMTARQRD